MGRFRINGTVSMALSIILVGMATASASTITDSVSASTSGEFNDTHDLKRYDSTLYTPRDEPVTINGSVDLGNVSSGGTLLIGFVDAGFYDNSGAPRYSGIAGPFGYDTPTYQSGAYAYFTQGMSQNIGPTDGNDGGELVQSFGDFDSSAPLDFAFTISPDGSMSVSFGGQSVTDTYGALKSRPLFGFGEAYPYDEFANGAYLAVDFAAGSGPGTDSASYSIAAASAADVPEPSSLALLGLSAFATLGLFVRRRANG